MNLARGYQYSFAVIADADPDEPQAALDFCDTVAARLYDHIEAGLEAILQDTDLPKTIQTYRVEGSPLFQLTLLRDAGEESQR